MLCFQTALFIYLFNRFYFPINFWGGVCTVNYFYAQLEHFQGLFIVICYFIFRLWPFRQEGGGEGHHTTSAPLGTVGQVRDNFCIFHFRLQPAAGKGLFWPSKEAGTEPQMATSFQSQRPIALLFIHEE